MKFGHMGILLILIISSVLAVSGCLQSITGPGSSTSATVTPVSTAYIPNGSVDVSNVNFKNLRMFEYTFNTTTGDTPIVGDLRTAYSTAQFGNVQNARRTQTNMTANTSAGLSITAVDNYTDPSGTVLGGHIRVEIGGQLLANRDLNPGEQVDLSQTSTPVLTAAEAPDLTKKLKNAGQDQVQVPAGSFTCTKYVLQNTDNSMTYWIAPNVPVPVKMTTTDAVTGKVTMSMELVGYS
jgi:hypothetical protein